MSEKTKDERLLYSGFTKPRADGWGGLTSSATYGVLGAAAVIMTLTLLPFIPTLIKGVIIVSVVLAMIPLVVSFRGRSGWEVMLASRGRASQRRSKEHLGRSGPGTAVEVGTPLPAIMADSEITEHGEAHRRFGLVRVKPADHYTIVFRVWPQGREWVDQSQVNEWVSLYGHLIAQIGGSPDVVGITTTVETLPESGQRVAQEFMRQIVNEQAPQIVRDVMWEAIFEVPSTEVRPEARIAVTFAANSGLRRRDTVEQAADIARRLPRMIDLIEQAGLPCRPMTQRELIAITRRAMSPSDELAVEKAMLSGEPLGLDWRDVGATSTSDHHAYFAHDSARSVSWMLRDVSKAPVDSRVLDELLAPRVDVPRKRVTFIYRPHTPAEATSIVDEDLNFAERALTTGRKRASEHAQVRLRSAMQARQEQALGAGITRFTILTTVTVPADGDLAKAESMMRDLHTASRLSMSVAHDQQSVAFLAGLGIGLVLPAHTTISERLAA
ncbi:MAG: SCO6880 family protein [Gordonia sp. (in: high G+C Gram-positive bacteria)]|uniref:SCO6880 family protein n=1 Tax=Gordonia sp. (in: high G+C Gram-positive bacteria) TaxID=84139 RepID=UPI003BB4E8A7